MLLHSASSLTPTLPADVFASTRATKGFIFRSNQSWLFLEQSVLCAYFVTVRSGWLQKVGVRDGGIMTVETDIYLWGDALCDSARQLHGPSQNGTTDGLPLTVEVTNEDDIEVTSKSLGIIISCQMLLLLAMPTSLLTPPVWKICDP